MTSSISDTKDQGGERHPEVTVRLEPETVDALDVWIAAQREPRPTRPEAIQRILAKALAQADDAGSIAAEDLNASNDE
jgi:hypothetical protein